MGLNKQFKKFPKPAIATVSSHPPYIGGAAFLVCIRGLAKRVNGRFALKEEHLDFACGERWGMLVVIEVDDLDPLEVPQDVHLGIWVTSSWGARLTNL